MIRDESYVKAIEQIAYIIYNKLSKSLSIKLVNIIKLLLFLYQRLVVHNLKWHYFLLESFASICNACDCDVHLDLTISLITSWIAW